MKNEKDIKALDEFIQQVYWGDSISVEESRMNLEDNLVQILSFTNACYIKSNGLMITENGYFITAKHCIFFKDNPDLKIKSKDMRVMDKKGRSYRIERICAVTKPRREGKVFFKHSFVDYNVGEDLALVKAKKEGEPKSLKCKIYNTEKLEVGLPVCLLTHNEIMKQKKKYGKITAESSEGMVLAANGEAYSHPEQFSADIDSVGGDSGGPVISPDGELMGILSTGSNDSSPLSNVAKIFKALELVEFYKKILYNDQ